MDHLGHGLALDHPIFRTPNAVTFEWIEEPRPKHYDGATSPLWPEGVPDTYRLAKFEKAKPAGWNPTTVSHEGFFTDVPGFENLAEGHSEKMLGSLSLARQGRWFYWGYSIDPDEMTAGAADTLVNVLHYMRGKAGDETVPFVCKTRKILWVYTVLGKDSGYKRGVEEHFLGQLTPEWRASYTPTFEGAAAWVAENLPYVFSGKTEAHRGQRYQTIFEVDVDAKALSTPNNERVSLERWLALVADESADAEDQERARRCLQRYVHPSIAPGAEADWAAWYREHSDRLVFVDSTGFWWQLDPTATPAQAEQGAGADATTPADLEALARKVDAAHRPKAQLPPVTGFRAALEVHFTAPEAEQSGQVDLAVRYLQAPRPKGNKVDHLMRYELKRAGKPIERGRDRFGYWTLEQGKARQVTEADGQERAACERDNHLAQQLVKFLDPGAVLRALQDPTPVATEPLRFGREKAVACLTVEGTLPAFPLLRLAGEDAPVRARIYVTKDEGQLLAVLVRPVVDGKVDEQAAEMVRLRDHLLSQDMLVPKVIEHFYRDDKQRLVLQSKVLVTTLDLRPEFAAEDFERPR